MGESAYESDRTLIGSAAFRARITADYETVHPQSTPRKFADTAAATQLVVGTGQTKSVLAQPKMFPALYVLF